MKRSHRSPIQMFRDLAMSRGERRAPREQRFAQKHASPRPRSSTPLLDRVSRDLVFSWLVAGRLGVARSGAHSIRRVAWLSLTIYRL